MVSSTSSLGICQRALFAVAMALVSCNNDKIEVYKIPKEGINVAMQSGSAGLVPPPGNPAQWTKPDGWNEQPLSEMRLGSFKVDGPNAASADVSVIAFPGEAGGLISNINRWRGQLQLSPLDEDQLSPIHPAHRGGQCPDLSGRFPNGGKRAKTFTNSGCGTPDCGSDLVCENDRSSGSPRESARKNFWSSSDLSILPHPRRSNRRRPRSRPSRNQPMTSELLRWLRPLTSLKLTIFCLACAMVLVFLGTLDQVHIGVYEAENRYFKSFFLFFTLLARICEFPGFQEATSSGRCS